MLCWAASNKMSNLTKDLIGRSKVEVATIVISYEPGGQVEGIAAGSNNRVW